MVASHARRCRVPPHLVRRLGRSAPQSTGLLSQIVKVTQSVNRAGHAFRAGAPNPGVMMESSFSGQLRGTATDASSSARQGTHGGEQVADLRFVNASRDEDEAAGAVVVRPGRKLNRRMR